MTLAIWLARSYIDSMLWLGLGLAWFSCGLIAPWLMSPLKRRGQS